MKNYEMWHYLGADVRAAGGKTMSGDLKSAERW